MERVEILCGNVFVLKTCQLGPQFWSCDVYEKHDVEDCSESFLLEDFGESEGEAIAMALSDAHH